MFFHYSFSFVFVSRNVYHFTHIVFSISVLKLMPFYLDFRRSLCHHALLTSFGRQIWVAWALAVTWAAGARAVPLPQTGPQDAPPEGPQQEADPTQVIPHARVRGCACVLMHSLPGWFFNLPFDTFGQTVSINTVRSPNWQLKKSQAVPFERSAARLKPRPRAPCRAPSDAGGPGGEPTLALSRHERSSQQTCERVGWEMHGSLWKVLCN